MHLDIRIYIYRSFMLFHAYMQVDIVRFVSRCFKPLSWACEQLLFILQEINRFLGVLFEFAYSETPCFLILDPHLSKLERLDIRDERIEFRGLSWDCQLTFDQYYTSYENLFKIQDHFLLSHDLYVWSIHAVMLLGEFWYRSLLGLKGFLSFNRLVKNSLV